MIVKYLVVWVVIVDLFYKHSSPVPIQYAYRSEKIQYRIITYLSYHRLVYEHVGCSLSPQ